MRNPVSLYLRVRSAGGKWIYVPPAYSPNHKIKPLYGIVSGAPKRCPEGSYQLRYRTDGKRLWETIGVDADQAVAAFQRKTAELQALAQGINITQSAPVEFKPDPKPAGRPLKGSIDEYLLETKSNKSKKTLAAYTTTLSLFQESCAKDNLEDIDRKDMVAFKTFLRDKGSAPRTVRNRVDYFQIFLHHFGLPSLLKGKDLPT